MRDDRPSDMAAQGRRVHARSLASALQAPYGCSSSSPGSLPVTLLAELCADSRQRTAIDHHREADVTGRLACANGLTCSSDS